MLNLGPIAFIAPWALAALLLLPALWWLLRLTPPLPKNVIFPPIRILFNLVQKQETSSRTPWWLLLLRLLIAALIIFAASRPILHAEGEFATDGPVILVVDNGWAAADRWPLRQEIALSIAERAARGGRQVLLLATAPPPDGSAIAIAALGATDARAAIEKLTPLPWPTDRGQATEALAEWAESFNGVADIRWLSDGLDTPGAQTLADRLEPLGRVTLYDMAGSPVTLLRPPEITPAGLDIRLQRPRGAEFEDMIGVRGLDSEGRVQVAGEVSFAAGERAAGTVLSAPAEILNRVERVQIANAQHAGAAVLLDQRWQRRSVGVVDPEQAASVQPLLSNTYYLARALEKTTSVEVGPLDILLEQPLSSLVVPDAVELEPADVGRIENWVSEGGVLVRFAGPAMARRTSDQLVGGGTEPLLPVTLRAGDRIIGGAMSWRQPMGMAAFPAHSPFAGIEIPGDAKIRRQVLAQPGPDLAAKTWATLVDGTPLVTAEKRDAGWIVLFHTAPNASWSDLPLSGVFVEMLQRLTAIGRGVAGATDVPPLVPVRIMDAFGRLGPPPASAQAIQLRQIDTETVSQKHPPGIYEIQDFRRALNLSMSIPDLQALPPGDAMTVIAYEKPVERELTFRLLLAALILMFIDMIAGIAIRTGGRVQRVPAAVLAAVLAVPLSAVVFAPAPAMADDRYALENSLETRLAYLRTGDERVDTTSALGLRGLTIMLARRTAAELGTPQPVEPGRDELAFFPLIYWPVTPDYEMDNVSRLAVKEYLRNGGTILFDTQERGGSAQAAALRDLAEGLDLPPLVPVSETHVLTRAFYLMQEFPGRYAGSTLWIERAGERVNDGVSPVIAGSSDWAAAWALDDNQRPVYPVVPGGERQREMAFRFGINLVMHVLTGNYKGDQVHLPAILKRLGQ